MIRVVVVDDEGDLRLLVRQALELHGDFEIVGEASDGHGAIEAARRLEPDAIVLDLGLPDLAAADVIASVRRASDRARIVVFSGTDADDRVQEADAADGYVSKGGDLDVLLHAIRAAVLPPMVASLSLDAQPASVGIARTFVVSWCRRWRCEHIVDDAKLVVSELVSNAIMHARSTSEVRLRRGQGLVRIEVIDHVPAPPQPRDLSHTALGGRGLLLIASLSRAWGVDPHPEGKLVWAELTA